MNNQAPERVIYDALMDRIGFYDKNSRNRDNRHFIKMYKTKSHEMLHRIRQASSEEEVNKITHTYKSFLWIVFNCMSELDYSTNSFRISFTNLRQRLFMKSRQTLYSTLDKCETMDLIRYTRTNDKREYLIIINPEYFFFGKTKDFKYVKSMFYSVSSGEEKYKEKEDSKFDILFNQICSIKIDNFALEEKKTVIKTDKKESNS